MNKKIILCSKIFFIYFVPILLILFNIIPFDYRFHVLTLMAIAGIFYCIITKKSLIELGFRFDNLKKALILNICLSLVLVVIMLLLYFFNLIREPTIPSWSFFFIFYVFISSPAQEFLYRSILFAEINKVINNKTVKIIIASVTFCFLHIIYKDLITLVATLFIGIIWCIIYTLKPNFWGTTLSHIIVGIISILTGII